MAMDRDRMDDQSSGPEGDRRSDINEIDEERVRGGGEEDIRGVAEDEDEEFEDTEDLDEEEEGDGSI